ncbi:uncharacterized protein [Saccopteryx bilineata]|uniref:uncharacterized protein isoform X2 n=1 Tax=Saccopteryx bilineata TaxID=59482 RepID=UPI00338D86A2
MARRRLLLLAKSYFARGGTGAEPGVTSPRGLRALQRNAGSGAAPPPPPAGDTRAGPGRAPRVPRRLCSLPGPLPAAARRERGRERGRGAVRCPFPENRVRDASLEEEPP